MSDTQTLYKLMILYMLSKIHFALPYVRISDFILERGYTDYFTLQESLAQLQESGLIHVEVLSDSSMYLITPEGEEMIRMFAARMDPSIRKDIEDYLSRNRIDLVDEVSALSEYYRNTRGEYEVRCRIREKESLLMDMTLTVPDQTQARFLSENWKAKSQEIYAFIMEKLMSE